MIDDTNTKELPLALIIVSKKTIAMIKIETITYIFCRKMANNKKNEVSISVLQFCTIISTGIYVADIWRKPNVSPTQTPFN